MSDAHSKRKIIKKNIPVIFLILLIFTNTLLSLNKAFRKGRIAGVFLYPDMSETELKAEIDNEAKLGVNMFLIWSYISDIRYKIEDDDINYLKVVSSYTKKYYPQIKIILYIAPLEKQTYNVDMDHDGKLDPGKKSFYTEQPEWVQTSISGRKAVFYGSIAFWIDEGSEDVWICPLKKDYVSYWIKNIKEIAKTGINGVWWDVPFFIYNFGDNWEGEWTCFSKECREAFYRYSGCPLPEREEWNNDCWRKFIDFRYQAMGSFVKLLRKEAKKINPDFVVLNEIWDENGAFAPQTGFSSLWAKKFRFNDFIAHEYEPVSPYDYDIYNWRMYIAQLITFRGIDRERPTWVLSYSHTKEHAYMRAVSTILSSSNFYETGEFIMSDTVGLETRGKIFNWIKENENFLYPLYEFPLTKIGVFYSQKSIDYYGLEEAKHEHELKGIELMLIKAKLPFSVITELNDYLSNQYSLIFIPNAISLSKEEAQKLKEFVKNGGTLFTTHKSSFYDENGSSYENPLLDGICNFNEPLSISKYGNGKCIYLIEPLGAYYYFYSASEYLSKEERNEKLEKSIFSQFISILNENVALNDYVKIIKGDNLFLYPIIGIEEIDGKNEMILSLRVINLKGLKEDIYTPIEQEVEVEVNLPSILKLKDNSITISEFLENKRKLTVDNKKTFKLKFKIKRFTLIKSILNPLGN